MATIQREMTEAEWVQLIDGKTYDDTCGSAESSTLCGDGFTCSRCHMTGCGIGHDSVCPVLDSRAELIAYCELVRLMATRIDLAVMDPSRVHELTFLVRKFADRAEAAGRAI